MFAYEPVQHYFGKGALDSYFIVWYYGKFCFSFFFFSNLLLSLFVGFFFEYYEKYKVETGQQDWTKKNLLKQTQVYSNCYTISNTVLLKSEV